MIQASDIKQLHSSPSDYIRIKKDYVRIKENPMEGGAW